MKFDDLSLFPGNHMVEGESQVPQSVLWLLRVRGVYVHIYTLNKCDLKKIEKYLCTCVCWCIVSVEVRGQLQVSFLNSFPSILLRRDVSLTWGSLMKLSRRTGQPTPGIYLSLLPLHWHGSLNHTSLFVFPWVLGSELRSLCLHDKALYCWVITLALLSILSW